MPHLVYCSFYNLFNLPTLYLLPHTFTHYEKYVIPLFLINRPLDKLVTFSRIFAANFQAMIHIIVAVGNQGEIGYKNQLLCHLPADLKHFKELTSGHTILMGRKTWDSLPKKPLPNRRNLVISRNKDLQLEGAEVFSSPEDALKNVEIGEEVFIIGGEQIYQLFINKADKIHLTHILADFEADAFFPKINPEEWELCEEVPVEKDEKNPYNFIFQTFTRKQK